MERQNQMLEDEDGDISEANAAMHISSEANRRRGAPIAQPVDSELESADSQVMQIDAGM